MPPKTTDKFFTIPLDSLILDESGADTTITGDLAVAFDHVAGYARAQQARGEVVRIYLKVDVATEWRRRVVVALVGPWTDQLDFFRSIP